MSDMKNKTVRRIARGTLITATLVMLLLVAMTSTVSAQVQIPQKLTHQGRVLDSSSLQPLGGVQQVTFTLYDNGTVVWTETLNVAFDNGYYTVTLGNNGMPDGLFDSALLTLGVQIADDPELSPRIALNSVPYAFRAKVADNVVGNINPASVNINGVAVINSDGQWVGSPAGLQGAVGPQGPQGPAGAQGPQGDSADPGQVATILSSSQNFRSTLATFLVENHADALRGPTGPQGPQGSQGEIGPQGPVGPQGPQGDAGQDADPELVANSLAGDTDFRGDLVDTLYGAYADELIGPQGPQGIQGPPGPQGVQGPQGLPGNAADPNDIAEAIVNNPEFLNQILGDVNNRLTVLENAGYVTQTFLETVLEDYVPRDEFAAAITNLQNQINANNTNLTNQLGNLQGQINDNEAAINQLRTQVGNNSTAISNLQTLTGTHTTQITNLQNSVNGHTVNINNLQNQIDGINGDINNVNNQVGTNSTNIANLQNQVNTNTTNIANNTTAITNLGNNNGSAVPFILGRSAHADNGTWNFGGKKGLAAASQACKTAYNDNTAHVCMPHEVAMAIAEENWDTNNLNQINNVRVWIPSYQEYTTVTTNSMHLSTAGGSCHNFNYQSGHIARGSTLTITFNTSINNGNANTNTFSIDRDVACSTNLPVMCCR